MQSNETEIAVIHPLETILERLPLEQMFPKAQPLEVELGSGDGSFIVNYTRQHPERNFIGVERFLGRIRKIDRKGRRAGLQNLRAVRIEAAYFLEFLLPRHCAEAIHIYFPDPWPKRKHWKNRLINASFPGLAANALKPGGIVYLRTDDKNYFSQMLEVFAASPLFVPCETPETLSAVVTDFERTFLTRGIQTNRAAYQVR